MVHRSRKHAVIRTTAQDNGFPDYTAISSEAKSIALKELDTPLIEILLGIRSGSEDEKVRLDCLKEKMGSAVFSEAIREMTRIDVRDERKAERLCEGIRRHKIHLDRALGREVSLEVAALDFMQNVEKTVRRPLIVEEETLKKLAEAALYDDLTGVYEHQTLKDDLDALISSSRKLKQPFCMLFADIDDFKKINDTAGHMAGDKVLMITARILDRNLRAGDSLYRAGGDEFTALLSGTDAAAAEDIALRIQEAFGKCILRKLRIGFSLSIGVAEFDPGNPITSKALFSAADRAMYRAKLSGKGRVYVMKNSDKNVD